MENDIRKEIFLKLIHTPRATFSDLWNQKVESNLFAYHLRKLEEEGLIGKFEDGYGLTAEGRKASAFIEGATGGKAELPTPTVIILAREDGKILCQERLKEPFYGYWGFPSGKINFGWNPEECAIRDFEEETGLTAGKAELKVAAFVKTYEEGKILHHHLMFTVEVSDIKGTLKEQTHKAKHEWLTIEEYKSKKRFPDTTPFEKTIEPNKFHIYEVERFMNKGIFTSANITSEKEFSTHSNDIPK